jgi:hypothetical protein
MTARNVSALPALACLLACLPAPPLQAADLSWSAFGTLGYARSNREFNYERFTDEGGTIKRDSLLGLQATAEFSPYWSATVQARLAPSVSDDRKWEAILPWAFVSYRAGNDLLLRAGKLRMPMYLYSENMDVGASYAMIRMPTEVYSTAPTTDYTGMSFSKSWPLAWGDLSLDGYAGRSSVQPRSAGGVNGSGNGAAELHTRTAGLVLSLRNGDDTYRIGRQHAMIGVRAGFLHPTVGYPPADGAYDMDSAGVPPASLLAMGGELDTRVWLLGADVGVGGGFRVVGEFARRYVLNAETPKNTKGAYATLLYQSGPWTPYATVARLLTDKSARQAYASSFIDDQSSAALGVSYGVTPSSKLKAEWMHVKIGSGSSLVDSTYNPASGRHLNVMSLSYSFSY